MRSAKAAAPTCRLARPFSPRDSACVSTSSGFPGWSTARSKACERAVACALRELAAHPIYRRELTPAQQQQVRRQSAAADDPASDRIGIGIQHQAGGRRLGIDPPAPIDRARSMEAEHRAARHADALARYYAQHQRAGGQARPIDHHALAGIAYLLE